MDTKSNTTTLATYQEYFSNYLAGTATVASGFQERWLASLLKGLPTSANVLEIGSATGRDAAYMRDLGYDVQTSDAIDAALRELKRKGFSPIRLNVITDEIDGEYDLILASAVFLHFTEMELRIVLEKLRSHIAQEGRLAFSVKQGMGDEWSVHKMSAPRYFKYWQPDTLASLLHEYDYVIKDMRITEDNKWLHFMCGMKER